MKADTAHLNHRFREQLITVVFVKTGKNLIAQSFTAFNWLPYCFQSKAQKCVLRNNPMKEGFLCVPSCVLESAYQFLIMLFYAHITAHTQGAIALPQFEDAKTHNPPVLKRCRIKKRARTRGTVLNTLLVRHNRISDFKSNKTDLGMFTLSTCHHCHVDFLVFYRHEKNKK